MTTRQAPGVRPSGRQRVRHRDQAGLHRARTSRVGRRRLHRHARRIPVRARHPSADVPPPAVHHAPVHRLRQPADTNERFKYLIANGQTGLNVAFDLPTQIGYRLRRSARDRRGRARRHGGRHACATSRSPSTGSTSTRSPCRSRSTAPPPQLIAMYLAMAEKRGYDVKKLRGTAQNDILKEFVGRGTWIYPVRAVGQARRRHDRVLRASRAEVQPGLGVRLPHPRVRCEPGAGDGVRVLHREGLRRRGRWRAGCRSTSSPGGCRSTSTSSAISSSRCASSARRAGLWAKIMKEQYGAKEPGSMWLRMIAGGGGGGLTYRAAGGQHRARRLLRADRGARRRSDDGAVLLRRGLHHPDRVCAAHLAAHDAAPDRGDGARRHRRSARRLLLRRDADQPDAPGHGASRSWPRWTRRAAS